MYCSPVISFLCKHGMLERAYESRSKWVPLRKGENVEERKTER
jgi:hypothetical protein